MITLNWVPFLRSIGIIPNIGQALARRYVPKNRDNSPRLHTDHVLSLVQVVLFTPGEVAAAGYTGYLTNKTITGLYAEAIGGAVVLLERELITL